MSANVNVSVMGTSIASGASAIGATEYKGVGSNIINAIENDDVGYRTTRTERVKVGYRTVIGGDGRGCTPGRVVKVGWSYR